MLFNYEILSVQLNRYLAKQYPGVTTYTDIFENAFLQFIGYQFVPEKCEFRDNQLDHSLAIDLRTPYSVAHSDFINELRICATGEFLAIKIEAINPNSNPERFSVHLSIPYSLIEIHISEIFHCMDSILSNPIKINFYRSWDIHARKFSAGLTIVRIENLAREKLIQYPHRVFDDVWTAIIQKNTGKNVKIKFLKKQVSVNIHHFPTVTLIYEENGKINKIVMTRDQIVTTLEEVTFDEFLIGDSTLQEFTAPAGISQFIERKYHRSFSINREGHYEIDLGYHYEERKALEKYGINELSSYQPSGAQAERAQIYVYDKENYLRSLLAFKEIKGFSCVEERWHQLTYYIHHQMFEKLDKELKFLLNLKAGTGVRVDYTELLTRLYQHAKNNLKEEAQENTIEAIEKVCKYLVDNAHFKGDFKKEIYNILFELTLIRMNQLESDDEAERSYLKKELFIYAQKMGLKESNHYLAEISGLELGCTFANDVNKDPVAVLAELADKYKVSVEENTRLKSEAAKRTATGLLDNKIENSSINKVSYFIL